MYKIKKIIDNNFIKLFKINNNNYVFYSLLIKKKINNNFIYALQGYNIKDVEILCNFETLNLSIFDKIEYITSHSEINKLYINTSKNNIHISGIIPYKIFLNKKK